MELNKSRSVGQIAVEMNEAIPIFEKYGIDYYKEGNRTLQETCLTAGVPLERVELELKMAELQPSDWSVQEPDWRQETMACLVQYIVCVHHTKTRLALDRIERIFSKLSMGDDESSELGLVRSLFLKLDSELRDHLRLEEITIFPFLIKAERALKKGEPVEKMSRNIEGGSNPIREVLFEHGMMDREFKEIEKLVFLFKENGNGEYFGLLAQVFGELGRDNQKHIHLENNILLKRAAQMGLLNDEDR